MDLAHSSSTPLSNHQMYSVHRDKLRTECCVLQPVGEKNTSWQSAWTSFILQELASIKLSSLTEPQLPSSIAVNPSSPWDLPNFTVALSWRRELSGWTSGCPWQIPVLANKIARSRYNSFKPTGIVIRSLYSPRWSTQSYRDAGWSIKLKWVWLGRLRRTTAITTGNFVDEFCCKKTVVFVLSCHKVNCYWIFVKFESLHLQ